MNVSEALASQVTGTVDFGDGLVLEVVTIPHVTVCQLMSTVEQVISPYAATQDINHAMSAAVHSAMVIRNHEAATVAGTEITVIYNRTKAEWEIRGLPETEG